MLTSCGATATTSSSTRIRFSNSGTTPLAATADLHLAHAETKLNGNGASPIEALAQRPEAVFTAPDRTQNFYSLVNLQGSRKIGSASTVSATLFKRQVNTRSYNGDARVFASCVDDSAFLCDGGAPVFDQFGNRAESRFDAINNIGVRKQQSYGGSLQWVDKQALFGRTNQFAAGLDYDHGRVGYTSLLELANLIVVDDKPFSSITLNSAPTSSAAFRMAAITSGSVVISQINRILSPALAMVSALSFASGNNNAP